MRSRRREEDERRSGGGGMRRRRKRRRGTERPLSHSCFQTLDRGALINTLDLDDRRDWLVAFLYIIRNW